MMAAGFFLFIASFVLAQFTEKPPQGYCWLRLTFGAGIILGFLLMLASASIHIWRFMP